MPFPHRHVSAVLLSIVASLGTNVGAQTPSADDVARLLDQLTAQIDSAEAAPAPEDSEEAAQVQLAERQRALGDRQAIVTQRRAEIEAATAQILASLPVFPVAAPPPPVGPTPVDPVVIVPQPEPDPLPTAPSPELVDNEDQGVVAIPDNITEHPPLSSLSGPLAFNDRARRILSRPGAGMRDETGATTTLPAFSVLYVFAEHGEGDALELAVGHNTREAEGWVPASRTEDWRTMLVMSYAPRTGRDRAVFFAEQDDVLDILDREERSADAISRIHAQIEDGTYDPEQVIAIEPDLTVDSVERPYLMPILDFTTTSTDTHGAVTILQLAALNRESTQTRTGVSAPIGEDRVSVETDARAFKIGVAFVVDTTRSMGPYINLAQDFVRNISVGLAERGLQDQFDFALVGFRDNIEAASNVGYLHRIYRDFGRPPEGTTLFTDVEEMRPADSPTLNWREDAFAGIDVAIGGLNWGAVDTRLVFLITDASPRTHGDPLAANSQMGPETINALAAQRNISLFVLHMQTEEAASVSQRLEGYDDTVRGQQLYARISQTGDTAISKYFSVQGQTERAFEQSLGLVSGLVIDQLGRLSVAPGQASPQALPQDPFLDAITSGGPVVIDDQDDAPLVAAAVAGELFRYQAEYLGAISGVEAPEFFRAWAVDVDIANPDRRALEVSVFVTREQLSDLANRLGDILVRLEEKELGIGDFFLSVQAESGQTAVDPTIGSFLPSFLDELPYGSTFMNMTLSTWDSLGNIGRTQLLGEVSAKLEAYNRIYSTQDGWITLDERNAEEQVYPLPLRDLP
jgi:serine/threonine-protein kinase PpkA